MKFNSRIMTMWFLAAGVVTCVFLWVILLDDSMNDAPVPLQSFFGFITVVFTAYTGYEIFLTMRQQMEDNRKFGKRHH